MFSHPRCFGNARSDREVAVSQTVTKVTMYGGIKWYEDFVANGNGYDADVRITDMTGQPTEHLRKALHDYLNFSQP
jgi:hypothetical protein